MRLFLLPCLLFASLFVAAGTPGYQDKKEAVLTTAHFAIHYSGLHKPSIQRLADTLEKVFPRILADLETPEAARINIYLFNNKSQLWNAVKSYVPDPPDFMVGTAKDKTTLSALDPFTQDGADPVYFMQVIIHEIAHCVSYYSNAKLPTWLYEGIAVYESGQFTSPAYLGYMTSHTPPKFAQYNAPNNTLIYTAGYFLVEYIMERFGKHALKELMLSGGDLKKNLGLGLPEFEANWFAHAQKKYKF
ncbi:MAG: hypothetical protein JWQ78_1907 [Sediminibacterium sp.]|nr:hypothetical protein [Sediminibacterium sp.]